MAQEIKIMSVVSKKSAFRLLGDLDESCENKCNLGLGIVGSGACRVFSCLQIVYLWWRSDHEHWRTLPLNDRNYVVSLVVSLTVACGMVVLASAVAALAWLGWWFPQTFIEPHTCPILAQSFGLKDCAGRRRGRLSGWPCLSCR